MKILHISSAKTIRGGEHQISLLIKHLSRYNVQSVLLCPSGSELSQMKLDGLLKMVTYQKLSPANILVSAFIKKLAEQEQIDIIHVHDPHSHQYVYFSYKLFSSKIPAIATRRVSFPIKKTSRPYYTHPMIKKVICVSESVQSSLDSLNIAADKRVLIHSGIPLKIEKSNYALRREHQIGKETRIIANLAALSPQKDYMTFVKTAKEFVTNSNVDVKFFIIGDDGGTQEETMQLVRDHDLEQHIVFTGYLPNARNVLQEIDVLLSTSVSEGLGNTVMEAMKYKVPIIATRCEGTVDLVNHNEGGLLAEIGDHEMLSGHLIKVLSDKQLSNRLVEHSFKEVQNYDIEKTSVQILKLYESVLTN